jgi:microcystin-dependent protein
MEPFLGEIKLVGFNFAPRGWALCAGQELQISQNTALFALLGTTFGGDGRTTFKLPTLPHNNSATYIIALQGIFPSRD